MEWLLKIWFLLVISNIFTASWVWTLPTWSKNTNWYIQKEREELNLCILSVVTIDSNLRRWLNCRICYISWNKPWMQNAAYLHSCHSFLPSHLLLLPSSLENSCIPAKHIFLPTLHVMPALLFRIFHTSFTSPLQSPVNKR